MILCWDCKKDKDECKCTEEEKAEFASIQDYYLYDEE